MQEQQEPKSLKLHPCSELPRNTPLEKDVDCLERINETFDGAQWIGQGQYGMAIQLNKCFHSGHRGDVVVKISLIDETELRVACELNALHEWTPIFPHTYGWLICHQMPYKWRKQLTWKEKQHFIALESDRSLMFTFIQPVEFKWTARVIHAEDGYRVPLFILLHGLWVARSRIGFNHGDIHGGNIMIQSHSSRRTEPLILHYNQTEVSISTQYVPRLIDYGRSSTTKHQSTWPKHKNDIQLLRDEFTLRLDDDVDKFKDDADVINERRALFRLFASPEWKRAEMEYTERGADLILPLLQNAYFQIPEIVQHTLKRPALEIQSSLRCFSCCASKPQHQIDHEKAGIKYFCNDYCYEKIHGICPFIE